MRSMRWPPAVMGFEPMEIAYLRLAQATGLGTADLAAITIVGDPISRVPRRFRRHSADPLLRLARLRRSEPHPRPHFGSVHAQSLRHVRIDRTQARQTREVTRREANDAHRL